MENSSFQYKGIHVQSNTHVYPVYVHAHVHRHTEINCFQSTSSVHAISFKQVIQLLILVGTSGSRFKQIVASNILSFFFSQNKSGSGRKLKFLFFSLSLLYFIPFYDKLVSLPGNHSFSLPTARICKISIKGTTFRQGGSGHWR